MMHVGPRIHGAATLAICVPVALPQDMRAKIREVARVKSTEPGNGDASILLRKVCDEADDTRTHLFLAVDPDDGGRLDKQALLDWYHRAGFFPIQAEPLLMTRIPGIVGHA